MQLATAGLLTMLTAGCAHQGQAQLPAPRWPSAPEPARVLWAGSFPDERALAARKSAFRRVVEFVFGLDDGDEAARQSILARPFGLAVHGDTLYVADPDGHQVLAVAWREGTFRPVPCALGWQTPMAVAVADDGAIYVADAGAARVVRVQGDACSAVGEGLVRPTGVALIAGRLFAVDPPQHAVFVFPLAGGPGARFGRRGESDGELNFPTAIAATTAGNLLVVDALNWRIVTYSPDGTVLSAFGAPGTAGGGFGRPKAVAVDATGRIFVSDVQYGVILVFDREGKFELAFGGSAREPFNLSLPAGLAIDGDRLFVADAYHHRVEHYQLLKEAP